MIANMSAARTEFQNNVDSVKQFMKLRKVENKVNDKFQTKLTKDNLANASSTKMV